EAEESGGASLKVTSARHPESRRRRGTSQKVENNQSTLCDAVLIGEVLRPAQDDGGCVEPLFVVGSSGNCLSQRSPASFSSPWITMWRSSVARFRAPPRRWCSNVALPMPVS